MIVPQVKMSEESNALDLSTKRVENFQNENGIMKEKILNAALPSNGSSTSEDAEVPAEQMHVHDNRQSIDCVQPEEQNKSVLGSFESNVEAANQSPEQQMSTSDASSESESLVMTSDAEQVNVDENRQSVESAQPDEQNKSVPRSLKSNVEAADQSPEQQMNISDASRETESLVLTSDVNQSTVKSTTSSEISPAEVPASDKGLKEVSENIQLIYEGMKDMKISTKEIPVSASGKKGRKPLATPRAKSTPVKPITSPPLTRSRSRDLRKFPSTPSSPKRLADRKTSESDSDDTKDSRGRRKMKRN
ncbi:unnamed protein product [Larinioides sclopetarius]|uniref:Uncharacterized protein n=1 Tax=Larinioides sclopetarius TaxID=280406 RepID=A0AAV1Z185_9ARAC